MKSYREKFSPEGVKVIVSGTALRDFDYLNYVENFEWIKKYEKGVFGICAGAHIISIIFGCLLTDKKLIGAHEVDFLGEKKRAYFLTSKVPKLDEKFEVLGSLNDVPAYFKVKKRRIYGALFHPEVLNKDLISRFLEE